VQAEHPQDEKPRSYNIPIGFKKAPAAVEGKDSNKKGGENGGTSHKGA
jgi:hypothetical protein